MPFNDFEWAKMKERKICGKERCISRDTKGCDSFVFVLAPCVFDLYCDWLDK